MHRLRHVVIIYESSTSECLLYGSKQMRIRRTHVRNIVWVVEQLRKSVYEGRSLYGHQYESVCCCFNKTTL